MIPRRAARETPESRATGAARISGHGVATTSTARARTGSPLERPRGPRRPARVTGRKMAAYRSAMRTKGARSASAVAHQPHQAGVGALRRRPRWRAGRTRPPRWPHRCGRRAARARDGQGLPRQRGLVEHRLAASTAPSTGTTSPGADDDDVAGAHAVHGHLLDGARAPPVGDRGRPGEQRGQLAPGPPARRRLERGAPGEHEGDDGGGQVLADRERGHDGEQRDDVHAHSAAPRGPARRDGQQRERDGAVRRPRRVARRRRAPRTCATAPATQRRRDEHRQATAERPGHRRSARWKRLGAERRAGPRHRVRERDVDLDDLGRGAHLGRAGRPWR